MAPELSNAPDQPTTESVHPPSGLASAGLAEATAPADFHAAGPPDLVVLTQGAEHQLHSGAEYRIGRDPESHIVVTDPRVSWQHGVLRVEEGVWILEDLGSTNGTFLGPHRACRVEIRAESVVRLGHGDDGPVMRCQPQAPAMTGPAAGAAPAGPAPDGNAASTPAGRAAELPVLPAAAGKPGSLSGVDRSPTALMSLPAKRHAHRPRDRQ